MSMPLYNDFVTGLDVKEGLQIGSFTPYVGVPNEGGEYYESLGEVLNADLSTVTRSRNYDVDTGYWVKVMTFKNDISLYASFWEESNGTVDVAGVVYNERTNTVVAKSTQGAYPNAPGMVSGYFGTPTIGLAHEYGARIYLETNYYNASGTPTELVTPATTINVTVMFPCIKADAVNALININSDTNVAYSELVRSADNVNFAAKQILGVYDLEGLHDYMLLNNGDGNSPFKVGSPDEPAGDTDTSTPGGGRGNYDKSSDPVDFPDLPTNGALTSGAIKAFVMGTATLAGFFNKLWNISIFDIETQYQKLIQNPIECIINLAALPVVPSVGNSENVKLGSYDTELTAPRVNSEYKVIDCGTLEIREFWGSALDYEPFTKVEIYLPMIGFRQLKTDDVMNSTLHLKYYIDVLSGSCLALIKSGQSVLYTYTGSCTQQIPVFARNSDRLQSIINAVGNAAVGNIGGSATGLVGAAFAKEHVQRTGDVAGYNGVMGEFVPYIIIHRPRQSLAAGFRGDKGYPSNISETLSSLSGYTEVEYIHLTNIDGATDEELVEIERLLKSGVII